MKAVTITERGSPPALIDHPSPKCDASMVLIDVHAGGVNFADLMQFRGEYPRSLSLPYVPGYEVAGVVVEAAGDVEGIRAGDRVAAFTPGGGGFAETAAVHSALCTLLPDSVSFTDATALLTQGLTASIMVDKFVKPKHKRILVTAAAGGVGSLTLQLASLASGTEVFGAASRADKATLIDSLGGRGSNYAEDDWAEQLAEAGKFDLIMETVGGRVFSQCCDLLADFGDMVVFGNASGEPQLVSDEQIAGLTFYNRSIHYFGFTKCMEVTPGLMQQHLQRLLAHTAANKLTIVSHSYPLENYQTALDDISARRTTGKVVLTSGGRQ